MKNEDYQKLASALPEYISMDKLRMICHISKRTASYLMRSELIPNIDSGGKTRNFKIAVKDMIAYLQDREINPEKYKPPSKCTQNNCVGETTLILPETPDYAVLYKDYPDVLNITQASEMSGFRVETVRVWAKKKKFTAFIRQSTYYIPKTELLDFMRSTEFRMKLINRNTIKNKNGETKMTTDNIKNLNRQRQAIVKAIVNQKGGVSKTTTTVNLGVGLAMQGKKVLVIDADPQGSLTASLGFRNPDELKHTLATVMEYVLTETPFNLKIGILRHSEGIDLMPANIELSGIEITLVNAMSRETILKQYISEIRDQYDYILIDTSPSLGMLTINALASADSVIIPVQPQYLSVKGLEQLLHTISRVRRQINPNLSIDGILPAIVDSRTNYAKDIITLLKETYGEKLYIFESVIPQSVRAAETSAEGKSIFEHEPNGKVAIAYEALTKEVLSRAK